MKQNLVASFAGLSLLVGGAALAQQPAASETGVPGPAQPRTGQMPQSEPVRQPVPTNAGAAGQAVQQGAPGATAGTQVPQQCVNDLQALGQRMDQDGFWLIGYGGGRWSSGTRAATVPDPAGPIPPAARLQTYPWGDQLSGMESPRYQIRVLYDAATVLAHRGDQQACQAVVTELQEVYDHHVARLRQAGVEPGQVTSWRQERIAAAQPVIELDMSMIGIGDITGTEVRNVQDRRLGTVTDVVMDSSNGTITHAIVGRGGFLGIGRDYVVVPWKSLRATQGLNTFVLDVSEQVVENAPRVDLNNFADPASFGPNRQKIDQYWQQHTTG